jgi:hypothetical protein
MLRRKSTTILIGLACLNSACLIIAIWLLLQRTGIHPSISPITADYSNLTLEELAMRFRFPDFYRRDNGEQNAGGKALMEMISRKILHKGLKGEDVIFLLGKPDNSDGNELPPYQLDYYSYSTLGGNIVITFKGGLLEAVTQNPDGEPDYSHNTVLLK